MAETGDQHRANILDGTFGLVAFSVADPMYLTFHTASLTSASPQDENECTFTGYSRTSIASTAANWTRSGNEVTNDNAITFNPTSGGETIVAAMLGTAATGGGSNKYFTDLDAPISVENGVPITFAAGSLKFQQT